MIQLNLLPDVKIEYLRTHRNKRMVMLSALAVSSIALVVLGVVISVVYGAQKFQLSQLDGDIKSYTKQLKSTPDLDKVLTIQNQLNSLNALHESDPLTSRLMGYMQLVTPNDVQISSIVLDYDASTWQISGSAKSLEYVNKYVDTLKFTKYTTDASPDTQKSPFSSVVLGSFTRSDKGATYAISLKFDPEIFSRSNKTVTLVVPKITSTRSETERPTDLFKEVPKDEGSQQ